MQDLSTQQAIQQSAQRINITGNRDGLSGHLLWTGIVQSEGLGFCQGIVTAIDFYFFCNTKVQQFALPLPCHQYIRRFNIAMHNKRTMCVIGGGTNLQK